MEELVNVTLKLENVLYKYRTARKDAKDRTKKIDVWAVDTPHFVFPSPNFWQNIKKTVEYFLKKERLVNRPHANYFNLSSTSPRRNQYVMNL